MKHFSSIQALRKAYPGVQIVNAPGLGPALVLKHQPTQSDVHINRPLTNVSIAYMQMAEDFVADRVFPAVSVSKQTDRYRIYPRGFWMRSEMRARAPGTRAATVGYELSDTTYSCDVFALAHPIADQVRANADADIGLDRNGTQLLTQQALLKKETDFVNDFFDTGKWTSELTGVAASPVAGTSFLQWNDANSTPVEDITLAKRTMRSQTGREPNKLTLGRKVYDDLCLHPDIIDRIKHSGHDANRPAKVNKMTLTALFEVEEINIMNAVRNTANEGQTDAFSFIGGNNALLTHTPMAPALETPSAGYTFGWTGLLGADARAGRMLRWRDEPIHSDVIENELAYDQKQTADELGYFFYQAVADDA